MQVDAFDRQQQTKIATGYLLTLDNQVDPTTGTVKLRAQFDNRDGALFPNQFVNARLLLRTLKDATLVPAQAVQQGSQGTFVYLIQPDETASMQPVKSVTSDGNTTAVEGVQPGVTVAASGFDKLQDGAKVTVRGGQQEAGNTTASAEPGQKQGSMSGQKRAQAGGQSSGGKQGHSENSNGGQAHRSSNP
jgi:multidrug efflux system membrane fusion protein